MTVRTSFGQQPVCRQEAGWGGLPAEGQPGARVESRPLPLGAASIWASWALLTRLPKGSGLRTLALPTDAVATVTADLPILGPACADVC